MSLYKATAQGNVLMSPQEEAEFEASRAPAVNIPSEVGVDQFRLALLEAGKLNAVQGALNGLSGRAKDIAQIKWEYGRTVKRDWPPLVNLAQALSLDLDALFLDAKNR